MPFTALTTAATLAHTARAEQLLASNAFTSWRRDPLEERLELLRSDAARTDSYAVEIDATGAEGWRIPVTELRTLPQPDGMLIGEEGEWLVIAPEGGGRLLVTGLPSLDHTSGTPGSAR